MDLTSKVNRLLAEFAGRIGLPSLSLDEEGMASLLFDEQVGVTLLLLAERERLLLEADVAGIDVLWVRGSFASSPASTAIGTVSICISASTS